MTGFAIGFFLGFMIGLGTMGMVWYRQREYIRELEKMLGTPIRKLVQGRR